MTKGRWHCPRSAEDIKCLNVLGKRPCWPMNIADWYFKIDQQIYLIMLTLRQALPQTYIFKVQRYAWKPGLSRPTLDLGSLLSEFNPEVHDTWLLSKLPLLGLWGPNSPVVERARIRDLANIVTHVNPGPFCHRLADSDMTWDVIENWFTKKKEISMM